MKIQTKAEVLEILKMTYEEFNNTIKQKAKEVHINNNENKINVTALFGYDNICKNQCTYCGMRAGNFGLKRYRIGIDDIKKMEEEVKMLGLKKVFLISGEDPKYNFKDIISMVEYGKELGLFVSLGAGEFSIDEYKALEVAGLDEYVLKFETSNIDMFTKIKPTANFKNRMKCIEYIKGSKMELASGNIIGLPHQTLDQVADDIMLMKELNISWAPIIPYMPVPSTPLAKEGGRGSLETTIKEISILRIMMPKVNITAQQPGGDLRNGLADVQGNLNALRAGANMLFVDMLPKDMVKDFNIIDNRMIEGMDNVNKLAKMSGMNLSGD
ncbi:biotin synthase BioB [Clostridium algidicarnis]|uniref:biotin synthase BioB n=1 Tax=Clostridium algidicarnis TaxID=37659 RepID=UPI00068DF4E5|nr:radical SAM protein [Clostridium algidicarnis]MBB6696556.1 radical SAM protein [Clostridium algidicarnis]MBU3202815.1 radical SAM protein [Clostridium algidicarnis]MBU3205878.1 radical SAM protein [Clostridium algidicarnis]MBU3210969.1 radical SAM protein [Clostridium algidicarnis]MBU3222523.1 radical SAM protein [Clostridium algidicarnis]